MFHPYMFVAADFTIDIVVVKRIGTLHLTYLQLQYPVREAGGDTYH